jgi:hypothetical protein
MCSRGNFWPDLHNLYLSFESEGDSHPHRLDHILAELNRHPPAIRDELAADLAALSAALSDLANQVLDSSHELSSTR